MRKLIKCVVHLAGLLEEGNARSEKKRKLTLAPGKRLNGGDLEEDSDSAEAKSSGESKKPGVLRKMNTRSAALHGPPTVLASHIRATFECEFVCVYVCV